jgi:lysophospholipase L1-like esterase
VLCGKKKDCPGCAGLKGEEEMAMGRSTLACASFALGLAIASSANAAWVQSWGASPQAPSAARGPFPATPSFSDQTLRQVVRLSAGGKRIGLRLTNEYGAQPLLVGGVHVAIADKNGKIRPGTDRTVTFGGAKSVTIPAGAPVLSDPVDIAVPARSELTIDLYLPKDTGQCTCHATSMASGWAAAGDQTGAVELKVAEKLPQRAFVSGVGVDTAGPAAAIVAFGDSITDGVGSTPDANRRWPDLLADRLGAGKGRAFGVVNEGISGNRLLHDGAGQSALARFDRDALAVPGVAYVIVLEGVNDLGLSNPPAQMKAFFGSAGDPVSAEDLIAADKQLIARAHLHGVKIFGATVLPYKGAAYWTAEGESKRQKINAWIRTGHAFDGVVDFDAAVRDPKDPEQMRTEFHAGDHLHGSDKGYEAMARAIDLRLFTRLH